MNAVDTMAMPAAAPSPPAYRQAGATFGRQKLEPHHFERLAIVYVRQSDPPQVMKHRESTALQYNLADLAVELGWPRERVLVIDEDLGVSGRHAEGRRGFQRMMGEVALNHVGIILGREMSRLACSCKDWYQLLEVCGVFGTVLGDQDGIYNPADYHDRLLLGLTGIMSEAELHVMRGRLQAGLMNKAHRGELFIHAPIGYVRTPSGEIAVDPDEQAQAVVRLIFAKFTESGASRACGVISSAMRSVWGFGRIMVCNVVNWSGAVPRNHRSATCCTIRSMPGRMLTGDILSILAA